MTVYKTARNRRLLTVCLLLPAWLAACSPLAVVNSASPDQHFRKAANIAYGPAARQTLDVYAPIDVSNDVPVVVFFYGGGWRGGTKENYEFVASALTEAGLTVVIPDYRLFPDVTFPGFVEDGAQAYAWVIANIARFGGRPDDTFIMGHSAGAHIAASIALDRRYLAHQGLATDSVRGFVGLSGPYDFLPVSGYLEEVFPEPLREQSQPIHFVSRGAPPTLLIHGDDDNTVHIGNSESLARRLRQNGVEFSLKTYEGVGHARVVAAMAPPLDFLARTFEDTVNFIQAVVADSSGGSE